MTSWRSLKYCTVDAAVVPQHCCLARRRRHAAPRANTSRANGNSKPAAFLLWVDVEHGCNCMRSCVRLNWHIVLCSAGITALPVRPQGEPGLNVAAEIEANLSGRWSSKVAAWWGRDQHGTGSGRVQEKAQQDGSWRPGTWGGRFGLRGTTPHSIMSTLPPSSSPSPSPSAGRNTGRQEGMAQPRPQASRHRRGAAQSSAPVARQEPLPAGRPALTLQPQRRQVLQQLLQRHLRHILLLLVCSGAGAARGGAALVGRAAPG